VSVLVVSHVGAYERGGHTRVGYHPLPCLNGASVASHFIHMIASGRTSCRSVLSACEVGPRGRAMTREQ
jgi:hypothetical protein